MAKKSKNQALTLIGLDIQGEWNVPLLQNAARLSNALFIQTQSGLLADSDVLLNQEIPGFETVQASFDQIIACETGRTSRSIFDFPAPRGRTGIITGNELQGVPKKILKNVRQIVSIPMRGQGMTSVNVAAAAAVILYALDRDLTRKGIKAAKINQRQVDLLIHAPDNPCELGSLFRSAWGFGWKNIYLSDPHGVWLTQDGDTIKAGRAAARREINPLAISPAEKVGAENYKHFLYLNDKKCGTPLSRLKLQQSGNHLIVIGDAQTQHSTSGSIEHVYIDFADQEVKPCFRHQGSILLAVISEMLWRSKRG